MKYYFDTEFMEDGKIIELLSIGIVAEDGREYYAVVWDADWKHANDWVTSNVLPHLEDEWHHLGKGSKVIAQEILEFVKPDKPEFWAYYADYDWVVLCQLYGTMVDLPEGWPMFCMDLKQLCVSLGNPPLPDRTNFQPEHHALSDARWTKYAHDYLTRNA